MPPTTRTLFATALAYLLVFAAIHLPFGGSLTVPGVSNRRQSFPLRPPPPRLPRALQLEHPLVVAYTNGRPVVPLMSAMSPLPENIYLMSLHTRIRSQPTDSASPTLLPPLYFCNVVSSTVFL